MFYNTYKGVIVMDKYELLKEAISLFLNLDDDAKTEIVTLLKSEEQPDGFPQTYSEKVG